MSIEIVWHESAKASPDEIARGVQTVYESIALERVLRHLTEAAFEIAAVAIDGMPMRGNRRRAKAPSKSAGRRFIARRLKSDAAVAQHLEASRAWSDVATLSKGVLGGARA